MRIDLPLLDDLSDRDLRLLRRSAVKVAARIAEGALDARALARRLDELLLENAAAQKPEALQALARRVDFTRPPVEAPRPYKYAANVKPSEFVVAVYGNWLAAGGLFQPDLRRLDRSLMKALDKEFAGRREALRQLVPTKSDAVTRHLEELVGGAVEPEQRKRLIKIGKAVRQARGQKDGAA